MSGRSVGFLASLTLSAGLLSGCQHGQPSVFGPIHQSMARDYVQRGRQKLAANDTEGAVRLFDEALTHDPANAEASARLGSIRAKQGHFELASRLFAVAVRNAPSCFPYALALADTLYRIAATSIDRDTALRAAARAYAYAHKLDINNFDAAFNLGLCYRHLGDLNAAVAAFEEAAEANPGTSMVCLELASIHESRSEFGLALVEYNLAIRLEPANPAAHRGCARVNLALSRLAPENPMPRQRAIAHLRRCLELDGTQAQVRAELHELGADGPAPPAAITAALDDE